MIAVSVLHILALLHLHLHLISFPLMGSTLQISFANLLRAEWVAFLCFFVFVNKLNWAIKVGWQPDQDQEIPCDLNRSVLHVVALPIGFSQACYGGLGQTLGSSGFQTDFEVWVRNIGHLVNIRLCACTVMHLSSADLILTVYTLEISQLIPWDPSPCEYICTCLCATVHTFALACVQL